MPSLYISFSFNNLQHSDALSANSLRLRVIAFGLDDLIAAKIGRFNREYELPPQIPAQGKMDRNGLNRLKCSQNPAVHNSIDGSALPDNERGGGTSGTRDNVYDH